jgi:glycerophosphoryl diester phosphodiesterase
MDVPEEGPRERPLPDRRRGLLSRRSLIIGGVGVGALAIIAAGIPVVAGLAGHSGKLVGPLLASRGFSIAHGGGSDDWPEWSFEAYKNAVGYGVDALELSLARTSDGVWFGLHDRTLDRTSGTTGFVASEHTWAEVSAHRISAAQTHDPSQPAQPYMRLQQLVDAYGSSHSIFIDPKYANPRHYPELFTLMEGLVGDPTQTFVAKGYFSSVEWARAAHAKGYATWGYYYGADLEKDPGALAGTQSDWSLLGLDYGASAADWKAIRGFGKPVVAHILPTKAAAAEAQAKGADGLMISGVREVLGH